MIFATLRYMYVHIMYVRSTSCLILNLGNNQGSYKLCEYVTWTHLHVHVCMYVRMYRS